MKSLIFAGLLMTVFLWQMNRLGVPAYLTWFCLGFYTISVGSFMIGMITAKDEEDDNE